MGLLLLSGFLDARERKKKTGGARVLTTRKFEKMRREVPVGQGRSQEFFLPELQTKLI